ncbi:MAG: hypothetical protein J6386_09815 [Candidatus Synoicihabitans palmerolidicus]|nr:hypothetical protein [Candidatus Synoicihabitans palmerolidicus]
MVSNLVTLTDVYGLFGDAPLAPYFAPTFENLFDSVGNIIHENGYETTVPLQQITSDRQVTTEDGAALVDGNGKLSGAYYSIRMGAQLRSHLSDKFAFSAGLGLLGAYVGTDFEATESFDLAGKGIEGTVTATETGEHSELILGYYADVSVEYWLTQRTSGLLRCSV